MCSLSSSTARVHKCACVFVAEIIYSLYMVLYPRFYHFRNKGSSKPENPYLPPQHVKFTQYNKHWLGARPRLPTKCWDRVGTTKEWAWRQADRSHIQNPKEWSVCACKSSDKLKPRHLGEVGSCRIRLWGCPPSASFLAGREINHALPEEEAGVENVPPASPTQNKSSIWRRGVFGNKCLLQ